MTSLRATTAPLRFDDWQALAAAHRARAGRHTLPARKRRDRGESHPIEDFLLLYYPYPLALLENWHPGLGISLMGEHPESPPALSAPFTTRHYSVMDGAIQADPTLLTEKECKRLEWICGLLASTRDRAPNFGCHGLHEWAMVYRGQEIRHEKTTPLRLAQAEIDAVVESRPLGCSHHDAFRFFAREARPMNRLQPTLDDRELLEQPGCVHANMDLYKWAAKAMPWIGSELLLDCFELALELRDLDMRASPYDLSAWGRPPVKIETAEGRKQYEIEQRELAAKASPLRERLIGGLTRLLESRAASQTPCQRSF
jgi:hypothetical protein